MFIPYSTDRQLLRTPWATISIIALCAVIEGFALYRPGLRDLLAFNPEAFHWWQPLTAMFAHADPMHLIGNMLFLWIFGSHVEDTIGIPRYLLLYVTAGFAGDWLQGMTDVFFLHGVRGGIGASGAIMGLVALFALRYRKVKVNIWYWYYYVYSGVWKVPALYVGAFYFACDLLEGAGSGLMGMPSMVGNFAHVGGFLGGVIWCYALRLPTAAAVDEDVETATEFAAAGAYGAAAGAMAEAVEHDPGNPELRRQKALFLQMKDRTAHLALPEWNAAFLLWVQRDEPESALDAWREARRVFEIEAFDPDVVWRLAVDWEKHGHAEMAAELYNALARRDGFADAPRAALRLGDLLARQGHVERARQWYGYVRRTWPDSAEAFEADDREGRLEGDGRGQRQC
ncbi:MAG: rhomboid family intramembrane serine protease [Armatimonadia bacterium]